MDYLCIDVIYVDDEFLKKYFYNFGIVWIFNFFYVFYFGGVWERMIGVIRRIFDGMLLCIDLKGIINEVFVIFMVEVFLIVNLRFLVVVLIDFDDLFVLIFNSLFI